MTADTEKTERLTQELEELRRKVKELELKEEEHRRTQEEMHRINRALFTLTECSRVLVRADKESLLLEEVCRVIVRVGGFRMAWVGYAEDDEKKTVSPVAYVGFEEGYLEKLNVTWADAERGRGPTGTAIRTGKICVAHDILTDHGFAPWRAEAKRRGYESSIALPLIAYGKTFGSLNIYAAEPDAFDDEEVRLLSDLAGELSYGVMSLRARAEHERAQKALKKAHDELEERVAERTDELLEANEQLERQVIECELAERALRESEELFRKAFQNANTGMTLVSPEGLHLMVNDILCEMLGYPKDELEGMAASDTVHPDDAHICAGFVERALAGEIDSQVFETRHLHKRGDVVWTQAASSLVRDDRGTPLYFITQVSDATERKFAEDALKWELGANAAIAELSKALLAQASIDDISYYMLENAKRLTHSEFGFVGYIDPKTGYLISSTITRDIWDTCRVRDKSVVFKNFTGLWGWVLNHRKPLLTNSPPEDPRSSGTPDGHVPIRRFLAVPALAGDILVGQIALANPDRDYTQDDLSLLERLAYVYSLAVQRKWYDDALHESERKYRLLIDNLPNVVFKGYLDWYVEFIDDKIEEMTGFRRDDFNSRRMRWNDVIVEQDIDYVKEVFVRALKTKRPYVREYRIRTKAGETVWVQEWSQIVFDEEGEVDFITGTFMDVTHRKRVERDVRDALMESQQREQEVSALLMGSRSVLEHQEFNEAARAIFTSVKDIIGAVAGYVALLSEDGGENEVVFLDSGGLPCTVDPDLPMPIRGLRAEAYSSGEVVFENDFSSSEWLKYMPEGHVHLGSVLFAPMVIRGRVEGLLGLANKPGGFTERDTRIAVAFSELAAIALHNSRTLEKRKRAESALRLARDQLEVRVQERTKELVAAQQDLTEALSQVKRFRDRLEMENIYLQEEIKLNHNFEEIIGRSEAMKRVLGKVEQVASTDATVLIMGETGTGKELFARAIHNLSPRNDRPLVKVNCAALQQTLIESELFGHEKGAFTGAFSQRVGRFELANNGTIFLDEIGDLSLELQSKLLRVIQEGELERLGGSRTIGVDVRVIAATHRELESEVRAGEFREDLYYRLNVFPISIPPLRERREDIPLLVRHFTQKYAAKLSKHIDNISQPVLEALESYPWSGNVRELENVIERAVIIARGHILQPDDFAEVLRDIRPDETPLGTLEDVQRNHIIRTLRETSWRIEGKKGAASLLGINPSTLRSRMHKLGIKRPPGVG